MENIEQDFSELNLTKEQKEAIQNCNYEIHDVSKFLEYLNLDKQLKKLQIYKGSDGRLYDLNRYKSMIIADTIDLPDEEQDKVMVRYANFKKLQASTMNIRRAAYGGYEKEKATGFHKQLLSAKKAQLLEYFGRLFSIKEVLLMVKSDWKAKDVNEEILTTFYRDNLEEINKLQEKHRKDYTHIRLSEKTSRLEELTFLYGKLKKKYEISNNREDHKALLSTIDAIRKEVEGDRLTIAGSLDLKMQQDVNSHLRNELLKNLSLKEIILARLSTKLGVQPVKMLHALNNSYYAKFNRLINDAETIDFEEIEYPSSQPYDFDRIKNINKDRVILEQREAEKDREDEAKRQAKMKADNEAKESIKQKLLEKLKGNVLNVTNQKLNLPGRKR